MGYTVKMRLDNLVNNLHRPISRRDFLISAGLAGLGMILAVDYKKDIYGKEKKDEPFLAIQTHAHDYFLEGSDKVCENIITRGGFNTMLFAATYVKESKWTNHQHGNDYVVEAGAYFEPDWKLYKQSGIKPVRAPSKGMEKYNALREVSKSARKAGLNLYAWMSDFDRRILSKTYPELKRRGVDGKPLDTTWFCLNNPQVQQFVLAFYEDIAKHHDVDGFFMDRIRYHWDEPPSCFCNYCVKKMEKEESIDVNWLKGIINGKYRYEQSLEDAWMNFRAKSVANHVKNARKLVKGINSKLKIGLDLIEPSSSFDIGQDYRLLKDYCDWIKPMVYHRALGRDILKNILAKKNPEQAYEKNRQYFANQGVYLPSTLTEFEKNPFMPPSWVEGEIRGAINLVNGMVPIIPGIQGYDVGNEPYRKTTVKEIEDNLNTVFSLGVKGIATYCYSNMTWEKIETFKRVFEAWPTISKK